MPEQSEQPRPHGDPLRDEVVGKTEEDSAERDERRGEGSIPNPSSGIPDHESPDRESLIMNP
jgi:hypothetical protein